LTFGLGGDKIRTPQERITGMRKNSKSKLLIVDMQLDASHNLRKLTEGLYYWFIDIEVMKSAGHSFSSKMIYYKVAKKQFPTFDDVMGLIQLKFVRKPSVDVSA
jgi:hypothetical protein